MTIAAIWAGIRALAGSVPWQVWAGLALLMAGWLWGNSRYHAGELAERGRWEAAAAKQMEKARAADASAAAVVAQTVSAIEAENERARDAAAVSDDPLKAALDAF
ncbi:MAG: hypothetical protein ACK5NN_13260 [Sphingomonadaceae bacterium]